MNKHETVGGRGMLEPCPCGTLLQSHSSPRVQRQLLGFPGAVWNHCLVEVIWGREAKWLQAGNAPFLAKASDLLLPDEAHSITLFPRCTRPHSRVCVSRKLFPPLRFFQRLSIIIHNEVINIWVEKEGLGLRVRDWARTKLPWFLLCELSVSRGREAPEKELLCVKCWGM